MNCTLNLTSAVLNLQKVTSIPMFIVGVLGNLYVLVMFCRRPRSEWTYMNVYITNMSIADCALLLVLPVKMHYYNRKLATEFIPLCNFVLSVYYVNMYVSIFIITAISVVRFVAIRYPMKAREIFSCRKAIVVCVLIWLTICGISPVYFITDSNNDKDMCFQRVKNTLSLPFVLLLVIIGFLLPFLIMLYCSVHVVFTLRKQLDVGSRSEKIQCMFIIIANFLVFVICFFPVHLGYILKYVIQKDYDNPDDNYSCDTKTITHNFLHAAFCISNMNCGLDCFSYFFATKTSWNFCCTKETQSKEGESDYNMVSSQEDKST